MSERLPNTGGTVERYRRRRAELGVNQSAAPGRRPMFCACLALVPRRVIGAYLGACFLAGVVAGALEHHRRPA